jgi:hypothetical protein
VPSIEKGEQGIHVFPDTDDTPAGVTAGIGYPVHREPTTLRRFVWVDYTTQQKHYLEEELMTSSVHDDDDDGDEPF